LVAAVALLATHVDDQSIHDWPTSSVEIHRPQTKPVKHYITTTSTSSSKPDGTYAVDTKTPIELLVKKLLQSDHDQHRYTVALIVSKHHQSISPKSSSTVQQQPCESAFCR
jgi:hypothetical protein